MKTSVIALLIFATLSANSKTPNYTPTEVPTEHTSKPKHYTKGMQVGREPKHANDFFRVLTTLRQHQIKSVPRFVGGVLECSRKEYHLYVVFETQSEDSDISVATFIKALAKMPENNNRVDSYIRIVEEAKKIEDIGVMLHLSYRSITFKSLDFRDPIFTPYIRFAFSTDSSQKANIEKLSRGLRTIQEVHLADGSVKYTWLLSVARAILDFEYSFATKADLMIRSGYLYPDLYLNNCPNLAFNVPEDYTRSSAVVFNRGEYYDIPKPTPLYRKLSTYIAGGAQPTGNFDALLDILKEFA